MPELIEKAAIRIEGETYSTPRPGRHHTIIQLLANEGFPVPIRGEQGFVTNEGRFVDRKEAWEIATKSGQCGKAIVNGRLFSEDIW